MSVKALRRVRGKREAISSRLMSADTDVVVVRAGASSVIQFLGRKRHSRPDYVWPESTLTGHCGSRPAAGNAPGVILIRGPSVMLRYMDDARATAAALREGPPPPEPGLRRLDWYVTADIGAGGRGRFLHIHDRVSRFSKIGGEMVPHMAIEAALAATRASPEAVEAQLRRGDAPGPRARGKSRRRLFRAELDAGALLRRMSERGMPNLWLPSPKDFHRVESLPFLPSGKLDLAATRRLAEAAAGAKD